MNKRYFKYDPLTPLNGIIAFLYQNYRDIYTNSLLVEASSWHDTHRPRGAIDFDSSYYWAGRNITLSFPFSIQPEGYEMQSSDQSCFPKEWSLFTSENGLKHQLQHTIVDDNNQLNNKLAIKYIDFYSPKSYKSFTISAISSYCSTTFIDLNQFEIYGTIAYQSDIKATCKKIHFLKTFILNSFFIFDS